MRVIPFLRLSNMKVKRLLKSYNALIKSLLFNIKVIIRHIRFNWIYKGMLALRPYQRLTRIKSSRLKKSFKAKLGILSAKVKGIKRPRWFQWNIFPKDGNPPTQSLFEITIYIVVLVICFKIFVCFNRIPQNYLTFEVEKIPYLDDNPQKNNLINYITKSMYDDTTFYLHYQIAEINLLLPMLNVKNDSIKQGCWVGEIYSDSMKVSCSLNNDRIKLNTYLDNYWHVVFSQAENYHKQVNDYLFSDSLYTNEFVSIFYKYIFLPEFGYMYNGEKQMLADKIAPQLRNRYYLSICSSIMKNPLMNKFNKNTTWKEIDRKLIYANKESNRKNFGRWRTELKKGIEYISFDLLGVSEKSKYYPGEKIVLLEDYGTKIVGAEVPNKEHFKLSLSSNSNLFKYTSTELPGWFDLNDISQASYIK